MKKYNREFYEFVRNHIKGTRYYEMARMVREKFGIEISDKAMSSYCKKHGLKNGLQNYMKDSRVKRLTTSEQDKFIFEHYKMTSNKDLAQMVNEKFGTNFTDKQMNAYKKRNKLNSGLTGRFEKGMVSHNKGKKMSPELYEKCKATMFKKGNRPKNALPVGTEIADSTKEHYLKVKVAEPNVWRFKSHVVWEQFHGPIPEGMLIVYLDGNNKNCDITNLALVSKAEHALLTTLNLRSENAELTKTGINIAKLKDAMNKFKKKKGKK